MRHDPSLSHKIWHADIPSSTLEIFSGLLPVDGARVWAVRGMLEKFLARVEGDDEMVAWIHRDIWRMLYVVDTPKSLSPINLRIPTDLYLRYDRLFPEWGATTWFIRRTLATVVEQLETSGFNLDEVLERAVSAALRHEDEPPESLGRFEASA